ncbi:Glutathione S-transferase S1 [Haplosporangium sp. Z 767]|nr:Glutathione S-transferase S1 [Haplosporangium sp. Z 767]KAF9186383.1 Glutathione S-transferase S1 [Haplosporangium sp. Z 11]
MSSPRYLPLHASTPAAAAQTSRLLKTVDPKDLEYEILYFPISCVGATPRHILTYGKANWHNKHPDDFFGAESLEKFDCPFGVMPKLTIKAAASQSDKETGGDVQEAVVTESFVIDLYLAEKFGLLGESAYEEQAIKSFYSTIHYLRERSLMRVTWTFPDKRPESWVTFTQTSLPQWIKLHEQHLENNGSNGHFVGDKISLADIHLVSVIDHFAELPRGEEIVAQFQASSLLWKVHETVVQNPEIAAWRGSEEFANLVKGGKKLYSVTAFEDKKEE